MSVLEKEDWKSVLEFLTNAKQVVSSVQDVARKVADYAKFRSRTNHSGISMSLYNLLEAVLVSISVLKLKSGSV